MSVFSILFIGLQVIVLPILSFQSREVIEGEADLMPPKKALFAQSMIMLSIIGLFGFFIDYKEALRIHWVGALNYNSIVWAILIYILGLAVNFINYKYYKNSNAGKENDFVMPQSKEEYLLWFGLCLIAAWSEELVYRGVLPALLIKYGMVSYLAYAMSAITFSFSHYTQGWLAIPITLVFALLFQYLYYLSGGLLLPILVHLGYNLSVEVLRRNMIH